MTQNDLGELLARLKPDERRGSKPRCHLLTHGSRESVADRLTAIIHPWGSVAATDQWFPNGFLEVTEARLDRSPQLIPNVNLRSALATWWLAVARSANTPNWDIASTCSMGGRKGLLLVEAKAHDQELTGAIAGKPLTANASKNSLLNHGQIGACIAQAGLALAEATGLAWTMSRDENYQMANRFAWSWELTQLGIPVILVYLGFLGANEMAGSGAKGPLTLKDQRVWETLVKAHSSSVFPPEVWNKRWTLGGQDFIPLIRAVQQPLALA